MLQKSILNNIYWENKAHNNICFSPKGIYIEGSRQGIYVIEMILKRIYFRRANTKGKYIRETNPKGIYFRETNSTRIYVREIDPKQIYIQYHKVWVF